MNVTALWSVKGQDILNPDELLVEQCYCPGGDYYAFIPQLRDAITSMARQKRRSSFIHRIPVEQEPGIPDVAILSKIKKFSTYPRSELNNIDSATLSELATEAKTHREAVTEANIATIDRLNQTYWERKLMDEEYINNMTNVKAPAVAIAQQGVLDAADAVQARRRKRAGTYYHYSYSY
jgi:hypothetical protein